MSQTQQQQQPTGLQLLRKELEAVRPTFEQLNLTGLSFAQELEFACQILAGNTYLQKVDKESIMNSLKNVALTKLSLNPILKYAYLVPRKGKCVLDPSYMGLCKVLTDTGSVIAISAQIVYEKEVASLKIKPGAGGDAEYTPDFVSEELGKIVTVYSVAVLPSGVKHVEFMRRPEWEAIMKRSESYKNYISKLNTPQEVQAPTWVTDEAEMIRKTVIKRHYKYLPKTDQADQVAAVIDLDNQANGIDFENENQPNTPQQPQQPQTPTTPEAPPQEALAPKEDVDEIYTLVNNEFMPDIVFGKIKKQAFFESVVKHFNAGSLLKEKAEMYIKGLKSELEAALLAKAQSQQPQQPQQPQQTAPQSEY